jgi:hypothetical protein
VEALTAERQALLRDRLKYADKIAATDPAQAKIVRQAIVDLYQDEPWATELVEQARKAIAEETRMTKPE